MQRLPSTAERTRPPVERQGLGPSSSAGLIVREKEPRNLETPPGQLDSLLRAAPPRGRRLPGPRPPPRRARRPTRRELAKNVEPFRFEISQAAADAERRPAMSYSIPTLLTRNLHDVFGENDPARRRVAIDEIFTEDGV